MTNLSRLKLELNNQTYYDNQDEILTSILEDNDLDAFDEYAKNNDQIQMLECVFDFLSTLANDTDVFIKVTSEFTTVSAAYNYLQRRLKDLRAEIDRLKEEERLNSYVDAGQSRLTSYMFFN